MSFDNSGNLMVEMRDDSESEGDTDISQERNQAGGDGVRRPDEARDNRKRGTKPGTKRGKYNKVSVEARKRIIEAYQAGEDWKVTARANGVSEQTAYKYIANPDKMVPKRRGGRRNSKMTNEHVEKLLEYVEENPQITLNQLASKLRNDTGLNVTTPTIHKHLHGKFYTLKQARPQPVTMNSPENKTQRAQYVRRLMEYTGSGKTVVYIDESNCNLFLRRSEGRSKRGTRCSVKAAAARGPNVHIIGAITQTGLVYWQRKRGSYRKDDCAEWLREVLRRCPESPEEILVVCDNAPVHSDLERIFDEDEFTGARLLRLAPYSAPLNPIEIVWSSVKAVMKREMSVTFYQMLDTEAGLTQAEHRLRYMEAKIDVAMETVTPRICLRACNHVQTHYAGCLEERDLPVGM